MTVALTVLVTALLGACGQKGPLRLPPDVSAVPQAAATQPAAASAPAR